MAEISKYEILLSELTSMETQVHSLTDNLKEVNRRNSELEEQFSKTVRENQELQSRITGLEKELEELRVLKNEYEGNLFNSLNPKERESLKDKLQSMISRIDYHLSSERQS